MSPDPLQALIAEQDPERMLLLFEGQTRVLEMIAEDAPLASVLDQLMRVIEQQAEGMLCSLLLLSEDGRRLRHCAAPRLPEAYNRTIDGGEIGPCAGSCGTAAFLRRQVIVTDIAQDPLWVDWRDAALAAGLGACWSTPILSRRGDVLGTFAMYYREPSAPTPLHLNLIALTTHLARIAIERERAAAQRAKLLGEQRRLERQLELAERLESLAVFAGGVAHDFNNLLTVILNGVSFLREGTLSAAQLADLELVGNAAERARRLTGQLLAVGRRQQLQLAPGTSSSTSARCRSCCEASSRRASPSSWRRRRPCRRCSWTRRSSIRW